MTKEQQIEEMAKDLMTIFSNGLNENSMGFISHKCLANNLYDIGYRKQGEKTEISDKYPCNMETLYYMEKDIAKLILNDVSKYFGRRCVELYKKYGLEVE